MTASESTTYCLYCYEPLERPSEGPRNCPRCGRLDLSVDHTIYWTRERSLTRVESNLKLGVILVLTILCAVAVPWFLEPGSTGPGAGFLIVVPLLAFGMLLWQTVSLVTHKPRYARVRLTWTLVFLLLPVAPLLFFLAISLAVQSLNAGALGALGVFALAFSLPCLGLGWLTWKSGEWFERWKQRRIARGAAAA